MSSLVITRAFCVAWLRLYCCATSARLRLSVASALTAPFAKTRPFISWITGPVLAALGLNCGCCVFSCIGTVYVVGLEGEPTGFVMLLAPAGAPGWLLLAPGPGMTVSRCTSGVVGVAPVLEPTMPPVRLLFEFVVLFPLLFPLVVP